VLPERVVGVKADGGEGAHPASAFRSRFVTLGLRFELAAGGEDCRGRAACARARIAGAIDDVGEFSIRADDEQSWLVPATVERDEIDLGRRCPASSRTSSARIGIAVVDVAQHHVFEGHAPGVAELRIGAHGGEQFGDRPISC